MKDENKEVCNGCIHKAEMCLLLYSPDLTCKCPCPTCLIKMMCLKLCDLRRDLYINLAEGIKDQLVIMDRHKRGHSRYDNK